MIYFDKKHNSYYNKSQIKEEDIVFTCEDSIYVDFCLNPDKYYWEGDALVQAPDWEEKQAKKEAERIANLNITKADFWIALLDRGITKDMVKEKINLIQEETLKAKTLIRIDEADHFWRGDAAMDVIGGMFGLTSADLTYLFENGKLPDGNL